MTPSPNTSTTSTNSQRSRRFRYGRGRGLRRTPRSHENSLPRHRNTHEQVQQPQQKEQSHQPAQMRRNNEPPAEINLRGNMSALDRQLADLEQLLRDGRVTLEIVLDAPPPRAMKKAKIIR